MFEQRPSSAALQSARRVAALRRNAPWWPATLLAAAGAVLAGAAGAGAQMQAPPTSQPPYDASQPQYLAQQPQYAGPPQPTAWLPPRGSLTPEPATQPVDLDLMLDGRGRNGGLDDYLDREMTWQVGPEGLIYHSYLAGVKEPRISAQWVHDQEKNLFWDSTLGGRIGILRYGTEGPAAVQGWQLDFEGAAELRQDMNESLDLDAVDFRAGIPLTFALGRYQSKFAFYHLSSHVGDEFTLKNPGFTRINFTRNVLVWGHAYWLTDDLRLYFEAGWAFDADGGSEPWEFQFGFDYAPSQPTGSRGAPFLAANAHLRQELNYGGNVVVEAGWAWRRRMGGPLLRAGVMYYNGQSPQFEFFNQYEQLFGVGLWYDF